MEPYLPVILCNWNNPCIYTVNAAFSYCLYIYMHILKRNYTKYTLRYRYIVINVWREGKKRGKLPRQMDENSRKSRDSDALGSVSTKRLSLTRTTRETRELICVIYIKRILFMNNDTNSSFVEFILNTYLHYTMIHRSPIPRSFSKYPHPSKEHLKQKKIEQKALIKY